MFNYIIKIGLDNLSLLFIIFISFVYDATEAGWVCGSNELSGIFLGFLSGLKRFLNNFYKEKLNFDLSLCSFEVNSFFD